MEKIVSNDKVDYTLTIHKKRDDWYCITSSVPGLFLAGPDLDKLLADVPLAVKILRELNKEVVNQSITGVDQGLEVLKTAKGRETLISMRDHIKSCGGHQSYIDDANEALTSLLILTKEENNVAMSQDSYEKIEQEMRFCGNSAQSYCYLREQVADWHDHLAALRASAQKAEPEDYELESPSDETVAHVIRHLGPSDSPERLEEIRKLVVATQERIGTTPQSSAPVAWIRPEFSWDKPDREQTYEVQFGDYPSGENDFHPLYPAPAAVSAAPDVADLCKDADDLLSRLDPNVVKPRTWAHLVVMTRMLRDALRKGATAPASADKGWQPIEIAPPDSGFSP